jgi:hypothetical protein
MKPDHTLRLNYNTSKKKKSTNGKSQVGFKIGGGRQYRNLYAQFFHAQL